jgi:hypothetical protein
VEDLSQRRKAICDKYPLQDFLVNDEWVKEYAGKVLDVSGVIERIGTGKDGAKSGSPFILLAGDKNANEFVHRPPAQGSYTRVGVSMVWCYFTADSGGELNKLRTGQSVTVRGKFSSSSTSSVQFGECSIQK